mmetsp:Transcript_31212/g.67228  ORF Transcript_31212/g.67228 Transcript_31212/m.67228 type:complete len:553 (-) Transcript_31212:531-2189(-)
MAAAAAAAAASSLLRSPAFLCLLRLLLVLFRLLFAGLGASELLLRRFLHVHFQHWVRLPHLLHILLLQLKHNAVCDRANARCSLGVQPEQRNVPEIRAGAWLGHHLVRSIFHLDFDGHLPLLDDVQLSADVPLLHDVLLRDEEFRDQVFGNLPNPLRLGVVQGPCNLRLPGCCPGGLGRRPRQNGVILEVIGHELGGEQHFPRDEGHHLRPQVVRQLLVQVCLREVNLLRQPHILVILPHVVRDVARESLVSHELVHRVDLRPVNGPALPASRVVVEGRNDAGQDESHEEVFHENLRQNRHELLRGVLSGVGVVGTRGPVKAVDVENEGLLHADCAVDEVVHTGLDGRVRLLVGIPEPRIGQIEGLGDLSRTQISIDLEVDGIDLDEEPNAREPVAQDHEVEEQRGQARHQRAGAVRHGLLHQVERRKCRADLEELQQPHVAQQVPGFFGRAHLLGGAQNAEGDRDRQAHDGQGRKDVCDQAVASVVPLDELLIHYHRPQLRVPHSKVHPDVGHEDEVDHHPVEEMNDFGEGCDSAVVFHGSEHRAEWGLHH